MKVQALIAASAASALLAVCPAQAQLLGNPGASVSGAAGGVLNGQIGPGGIAGSGSGSVMGGAQVTTPDASGATRTARAEARAAKARAKAEAEAARKREAALKAGAEQRATGAVTTASGVLQRDTPSASVSGSVSGSTSVSTPQGSTKASATASASTPQ